MDYEVTKILDNLKTWFKFATVAGISISIDDIRVPESKVGHIIKSKKESYWSSKQFSQGF